MASPASVCMIGGDGETSYAKNSAMQSGVQSMLKPLVEDAISDLCGGAAGATPPCLRVADLGCSSGPNALALASAAVDAVRRRQPPEPGRRCREICVFLNDLPNNDFNTVFKDVPPFLREHGNVVETAGAPLVMVFGAPGSFYGRLFPAETLHLVCSNFSLHWLSQVPQELVDGELVNKGSVCAGRTSSPAVAAAYARQFDHDFERFLSARAEEVVPGGWMVLSLWGRAAKDLRSSQDTYPELIAEILQDMASRGVIPAEEVDSFNEPFYSPCLEELRGAVEREGSFEVAAMESRVFTERGPRGDAGRARAMARSMRVLDEWLLVQHFRVEGVGDAYAKAAEERFMGPAAEQDSTGAVLLVSLRRK
ncbi:unnamed protein product [Urochloa humidicola]